MKMPHYGAFHLGHHSLSKYLFAGIQNERRGKVPFSMILPSTLCIGETAKQVLLQAMKNQMKCLLMRHFIRVYIVKVKMIFRQKNTICFENYNLTPLDKCSMDHPKFIVSNQKEESISIERVKGNMTILPFR